MRVRFWWCLFLAGMIHTHLWAQALPPAEIESLGGFGLAYGDAGAAIHPGGTSVIRSNPALMTLVRRYEMSAAYHWPLQGREFYQVGIVDSVSSQLAAGVQVTGFLDDVPVGRWAGHPVKKRVHAAMSMPLGQMALGFNGQHVTWQEGYRARQAQTYGVGLAGAAGAWVWGLSGENLRYADAGAFAPQTLRAGLSWQHMGFLVGAEGRSRSKVPQEFSHRVYDLRNPKQQDETERMGTVYAAYHFPAAVTVMGAYSRTPEGLRQEGSFGVVWDQQPIQISWQARAPSLQWELHHALALNLHVKV